MDYSERVSRGWVGGQKTDVRVGKPREMEEKPKPAVAPGNLRTWLRALCVISVTSLIPGQFVTICYRGNQRLDDIDCPLIRRRFSVADFGFPWQLIQQTAKTHQIFKQCSWSDFQKFQKINTIKLKTRLTSYKSHIWETLWFYGINCIKNSL